MKRNFLLTFFITGLLSSAFAQAEMEAYNMSSNDLKGTARSVSMGGAFGALGGDPSGVAINPAGIGVYKTSELVTTLNFNSSKTSTKLLGTKTDDSKFNFMFDNMSVVGVFPLNSDVVPYLNFSFAYNRLKSFNRNIGMNGKGLDYSITDEMAALANDKPNGVLDINYSSSSNWLAILGYDSYLIDTDKNGVFQSMYGGTLNNNLLLTEKGGIDSYDLTMGTTISDFLSLGLTVALTDVNYKLSTTYSEQFSQGGNIFVDNHLKTEGAGWQVKAGVIIKPTQALRVGIAYHSPTWYNMTDYFYAEAGNNKGGLANTPDRDNFNDYKLRTPDKWTFSLAGVIGKTAIISADYELTNYGSMDLKDQNDRPYTNTNKFISEDFKSSSTVRVGAEIRFTPQFSGRVGYAWSESPLKGELADRKIVPELIGTNHAYILPDDTHQITYGLGYKFSPNFYADVAFIMKNQKADLYAYATADKAELKNNAFSGLLTFGYRF